MSRYNLPGFDVWLTNQPDDPDGPSDNDFEDAMAEVTGTDNLAQEYMKEVEILEEYNNWVDARIKKLAVELMNTRRQNDADESAMSAQAARDWDCDD